MTNKNTISEASSRKKPYVKPQIEVVKVELSEFLLAQSYYLEQAEIGEEKAWVDTPTAGSEDVDLGTSSAEGWD